MNTIGSLSTVNSIFNSIEQLAQMCLDSVEVAIRNEELSVDGFRGLSSVKMQLLQMKKIIRSYSFLSAPLCGHEELRCESFCWSDFPNGIESAVKSVFPSYKAPLLSFTGSFETEATFITNRRRFDLLIYSIIYILIAESRDDTEPRPVKITFHLTNGKDFFVLHIRNGERILEPERVNAVLSEAENRVWDIKFDGMGIESELAVIAKSAKELGFGVRFSALKSGDKFEIHIPVSADSDTNTMASPRTYAPDREVAAEIFSDMPQFCLASGEQNTAENGGAQG